MKSGWEGVGLGGVLCFEAPGRGGGEGYLRGRGASIEEQCEVEGGWRRVAAKRAAAGEGVGWVMEVIVVMEVFVSSCGRWD